MVTIKTLAKAAAVVDEVARCKQAGFGAALMKGLKSVAPSVGKAISGVLPDAANTAGKAIGKAIPGMPKAVTPAMAAARKAMKSAPAAKIAPTPNIDSMLGASSGFAAKAPGPDPWAVTKPMGDNLPSWLSQQLKRTQGINNEVELQKSIPLLQEAAPVSLLRALNHYNWL